MKTYNPTPGTVPFRACEWLCAQPVGSKATTAELAAALDVHANRMHALLALALKSGLIVTEKCESGRILWGLGCGKPPAQIDQWPIVGQLQVATDAMAADAVADLCRNPRAPEPTPSMRFEPLALNWTPAAHPKPAPVQAPSPVVQQIAPVVPAAQPAFIEAVVAVEQPPAPELVEVFQPHEESDEEPDEEPEPFVCALWSDGQLQMQRGDSELILLSVDETRLLVHYLERMAVAE